LVEEQGGTDTRLTYCPPSPSVSIEGGDVPIHEQQTKEAEDYPMSSNEAPPIQHDVVPAAADPNDTCDGTHNQSTAFDLYEHPYDIDGLGLFEDIHVFRKGLDDGEGDKEQEQKDVAGQEDDEEHGSGDTVGSILFSRGRLSSSTSSRQCRQDSFEQITGKAAGRKEYRFVDLVRHLTGDYSDQYQQQDGTRDTT